ncbi:MAG: quinolinate synthase NadA, partial [Deltaproteobacteria bacterium]|nr:quinolinate synthase NadA [Deltaproteobacteria bacterium]
MDLSERKKAQVEQIKELSRLYGIEILAHYYQRREVKFFADFVGGTRDILRRVSLGSKNAVVICGVSFMAESARRLRPELPIILPREDASCPYSEGSGKDLVLKLKKKYPEYFIVA